MDYQSDNKIIPELIKQVGDINILINNAGSIPAGNLEILDETTWRTRSSSFT